MDSKNSQYTVFAVILGNIIKRLRNQSGLNQSDVAKKVGVNTVTMSRIENGEAEISVPMLTKINRLFDKDLMKEANIEVKILEKNGIKVYDSIKDVPKEKREQKESNTGKFIAGAVAIGTIIAFLSRLK